MFDPTKDLLTTVLAGVLAEPAPTKTWADAREAMTACKETAGEIATAIAAEDKAAIRQIMDQWNSNQRPLTEHDRELLKEALKAYRKRLKLTVLDAESSLGGRGLSQGKKSGIVGIKPPDTYGRAVWDELVRQKRLVAEGQGVYGLPPGP